MEVLERADMIADLVEKYKQGGQLEQIKREAKAVFAFVRPADIAAAEKELSERGLGPADLGEVHRLHLDNLRFELEGLRAAVEPWHPLRTMLEEHDEILRNLERLEALKGKMEQADILEAGTVRELADVAANLLAAEPHHAREEAVVFPELARRGLDKAIEAMESEHEDLRAKKRELQALAGRATTMPFADFRQALSEVAEFIIYNLSDHIYKENHIIFPAALRLVQEKELWPQLKKRCDEIGYCRFQPLQ
jgi:DUF438 domain-containing protein